MSRGLIAALTHSVVIFWEHPKYFELFYDQDVPERSIVAVRLFKSLSKRLYTFGKAYRSTYSARHHGLTITHGPAKKNFSVVKFCARRYFRWIDVTSRCHPPFTHWFSFFIFGHPACWYFTLYWRIIHGMSVRETLCHLSWRCVVVLVMTSRLLSKKKRFTMELFMRDDTGTDTSCDYL
jgi:hypothetical protein